MVILHHLFLEIGFSDFIQIMIPVVLISSAVIALKEIKATRNIHSETLLWNKLNITQDILNKLRDNSYGEPLLVETFNKFRKNPGDKIPLNEILEAMEKDPMIGTYISNLLNSYESISRGINLKLYDEMLVKLSRKTVMTYRYIEFHEFIEHRRTISNPNAWRQFETLVRKWNHEKLEVFNDGKVF